MDRSGLIDLVMAERRSLEVFCRCHPLEALRPGLEAAGVIPQRQLLSLPSGALVTLSGLVVFFHTPPVRSGRRIIFATLEDETGLFDMVVLPEVQERWARVVYGSELLTMRGRLQRRGWKGRAISITMHSALPSLCGSFEDVAERLARLGGLNPIPGGKAASP